MRAAATEFWLVSCLAPILVGAVGVASLGPAWMRMEEFQLWMGLASAGWVAAVLFARRVARERSSVLLGAVVAGAVALRLLLLAGEPDLSDDVYRYVWEGTLVASGESPYAAAPAERSAMRAARPRLYERVGHPEVSAAYPPLTQATAALAVRASEAVPPDAPGDDGDDGGARAAFVLRLVFGAADLLVLWPLAVLARRRVGGDACLVAWAWSPLVALEFAGVGHFDSLGILFLVAGLALATSAARAAPASTGAVTGPSSVPLLRASLAGACLGLGVLVKFLPGVALPFVARSSVRGVGAVVAALACVGAGFASLLLLEGGWSGLGVGVSTYALRWESFHLLYGALEAPLALFLEPDGSLLDLRRVGRLAVVGLWLAALARAWRARLDPVRASGLAVGAFLVFTPTLHPWYAAWIVPFVALRPRLSWLLLLALLPLAYLPVTGWRTAGLWEEPGWLWPVVALPFLFLATVELARGRPGRIGDNLPVQRT